MNSDRADKILYFPILTFGRGDSDASRRFVTWGIEIYNQIIMNTFQVSRILMLIQETAGRATACNLALPAGGIRRPHPRLIIWGRGCGNAWSLCARPRRFDRKHMIKNIRIPRYKTIIPDSEISDGTTHEYADSEARAERFLPKKNFSDRADKTRYFLPDPPSLKCGREDSDAFGGFITWGIDIYNQIMRLSILRVKTIDRADKILYFPSLTFGRENSDASRRFVTWGIEIYNQIMRLSILRVKTIEQIRKQGGVRRITWHCRRGAFAPLTRVLTSVGRGCGSAWSLSDMPRRFDRKHMIENMRIPRYKPIIPDSEVSDGTRPACADSEARAERFLQKRNFSDRADINLYFPILTFGRGYSDASRRFVTRGIEIYNQIKGLSILRVKNRIALHIFPILTFGRGYSDASRRFVTWGIEIYNQIKGLSILRVKTIEQIRKQGGARPITSHCRRAAFAALTRVLTSVGRGCGSAWSLSASHRRGSIKRYD